MTWIKICGTTNLEDALTAVDAGADALGFIFYAKSPRNVDPETVREIVAKLPDMIEKVGVFVGTSMLDASDIADRCRLDMVQLYVPFSIETSLREASPLGAIASGQLKKTLLAFSAPDLMGDNPRINVEFSSFTKTAFNTILLDSGTSQQPGGTGRPFDWKAAVPLLESMRQNLNVVIAGGLNPSNVTEAIRILNPWGVDVVSGVESSPGKKDPEKVRAFISAVRKFEKSTQ
ncbi:MAG TPA: phosphoribosylanthranilate isomerase [Terriglobales bacterium]|nr:phosphoribosylanthranilate isomerase [Terriglobales bacterium]